MIECNVGMLEIPRTGQGKMSCSAFTFKVKLCKAVQTRGFSLVNRCKTFQKFMETRVPEGRRLRCLFFVCQPILHYTEPELSERFEAHLVLANKYMDDALDRLCTFKFHYNKIVKPRDSVRNSFLD